jgi:hypothetical protein
VNQPHPGATFFNDIFSLFALGERFKDEPKLDLSAFFQDANYHDQIVKDRRRIGQNRVAFE